MNILVGWAQLLLYFYLAFSVLKQYEVVLKNERNKAEYSPAYCDTSSFPTSKILFVPHMIPVVQAFLHIMAIVTNPVLPSHFSRGDLDLG